MIKLCGALAEDSIGMAVRYFEVSGNNSVQTTYTPIAGFDPVYGARPLKRAIQQKIENPLAQKILAGDFSSGEVVNIDVEDGEFRFS
jgi:ATP-dependent Clp protease ATP-binding subunit ClpA